MNDVIIIGGGPAGSKLGYYLSMAGISNSIIESAIHPQPHVGESMVTAMTREFKETGDSSETIVKPYEEKLRGNSLRQLKSLISTSSGHN